MRSLQPQFSMDWLRVGQIQMQRSQKTPQGMSTAASKFLGRRQRARGWRPWRKSRKSPTRSLRKGVIAKRRSCRDSATAGGTKSSCFCSTLRAGPSQAWVPHVLMRTEETGGTRLSARLVTGAQSRVRNAGSLLPRSCGFNLTSAPTRVEQAFFPHPVERFVCRAFILFLKKNYVFT